MWPSQNIWTLLSYLITTLILLTNQIFLNETITLKQTCRESWSFCIRLVFCDNIYLVRSWNFNFSQKASQFLCRNIEALNFREKKEVHYVTLMLTSLYQKKGHHPILLSRQIIKKMIKWTVVVFLTRWTCTIKVFIAILHIFELYTWVRIIVFTLSLFLQFFSQVFTKFPKW